MIVSGEQCISAMHVSILPRIPLPSRLSHNIEQSSMCYTTVSYWSSILNIDVCNFFIFVWEDNGHTHTHTHTLTHTKVKFHSACLPHLWTQLAGGKGQVSWPKYAAHNILYTSVSNHHGPHWCISQLYAKLRRQWGGWHLNVCKVSKKCTICL